MATYTELYDAAKSNTDLSNRITAACQDLANTILQEASPSAPRKAWAQATRDNPEAAVAEVLWPVLIENKAATIAQINAAADAAVLTAVTTQISRRYGAA